MSEAKLTKTARRRRTAEEARREILEAARVRLAKGGPEAVRLQDVAADVGISHPAILHHFESREGLLQALATSAMEELNDGLVRDIESTVIRIGARRGNDVQISDAKVSGLHCEIRLDERGYRLRDLDSTNGTFVQGLRINDVYVQPGTQIAVGSTRMRFEPLGESVEVEISERDRLGSMIGRSVKMRELFARLEKLARSDTTVLTARAGPRSLIVASEIAASDSRPRIWLVSSRAWSESAAAITR